MIWADSAGGRQTYRCEHRWTVTSQNEGTFSGTFQSVASGPNDGPFCATEGSFTGTMSNGNTLRKLRFTRPFAPAECARILGDGTLAGTVTVMTARTSPRPERVVAASI